MTTILMYLVIAISFCVATYEVWNKVDRVVEDLLQQTADNSHNIRDFGLLHSRLSVFRNTFFGNDAYFQSEGRSLRRELAALQSRVGNTPLKDLLSRLSEQLDRYLKRGQWINNLLSWRSEQDSDLDDLLQMLQELIADRSIETALEGGDTSYFEQLVMLTSGYRESLLEIAKLNAEEDRAQVLASQSKNVAPLASKLDSLALRLRTLTASEPQISRFGAHLISRVQYYKYLMRLYQLEMIQLNRQNIDLGVLTGQILGEMEVLGQESAAMATQARAEIKQTMYAAVVAILGLLSFLALLSWISHHHLFKFHIEAPMDQVSKRLTDFRNGDHTTPMNLQRRDEWGGIEEIFNQNLAALQDSLAALSDSEKRYRGIFTNAMEGIFRSTVEGQFIDLNPAAVKMLGCDSVEDVKTHYNDLGQQLYLSPQVREDMIETMYRDGRNMNFEVIMQRKSGEQFWCVVNNFLVRGENGEALYIEGTLRDVSERREAQESLRQIKVYLQNLIDSMPSVLVGLDNRKRVILWNKRAEQESILTAEEAKGKKMVDVCGLFDPDKYLPELENVLCRGEQRRLSKVESLKKAADGGSRYFDILIFPLSSREDSGAVIHMDDVTERVRFEERMVRSEKMRSVGSLASGLAHEINNPLAAILQNVQVLSRRLSPELSKNNEVAEELGTTIDTISRYVRERGCEKMLGSIADAGQRAAKIVSNMQSFSRQASVSFAPCSMVDLIERTLDLASSDYDMRYHYDFQKIEIIRDFSDVPSVSCEPSHIQQALLSLFKNAAQAMAGQSECPCLTIRLVQTDRAHVCVQVEDNGRGMDPEVSSRIFDPFYTTQDVGRGSGLGLSIAYFIITQTHKGQLTVISSPDRGSRFDMELPIEHE